LEESYKNRTASGEFFGRFYSILYELHGVFEEHNRFERRGYTIQWRGEVVIKRLRSKKVQARRNVEISLEESELQDPISALVHLHQIKTQGLRLIKDKIPSVVDRMAERLIPRFEGDPLLGPVQIHTDRLSARELLTLGWVEVDRQLRLIKDP
jgi:hypothetical protein